MTAGEPDGSGGASRLALHERAARGKRRRAAALLVVALALAGSVAVAILWQSATLRRWAASRVVAELSRALDAEVEVGRIDVSAALPLRLVLEDVQVRRQDRTLVRIRRVVAEPRLGPLVNGEVSLVSLLLEAPQFDVSLADVRDPLPDRPGRAAAAPPRVDSLRISDGVLSLHDDAAGFDLHVPRFAASSPGFLSAGRVYVRFDGKAARLEVAGNVIQPVDFSGRLAGGGRGLKLDDGRIESPGVSAWIEGALALPAATQGSGPPEPSLVARVGVVCSTGPLVALAVLPEGAPLGVVEWDGEVRATPRGWSATGRLSSDVLEARQDLRPLPALRDLSGRLTFAAAAIELEDLAARVGSGRLAGSVRATRGKEGWLLAGTMALEDLAIAEIPLPRGLHATRPEFEGALALDVDGVLPLWDPGAARLSWGFGIAPGRNSGAMRILGEGRGRLRHGRVEIDSLDLGAGGAELALSGSCGLDGADLDLAATLQMPWIADTVDRLAPNVRALASVDGAIDGSLVVTGSVTGSARSPVVEAVVSGADLSLGGFPAGDLDGRLRWDGTLSGSARLDGPGLVLLLDDVAGGAGSGLDGRWELVSADAREISEAFGLPDASGALDGSGTFSVAQDRRVVAGAIEGEGLVLAGRPFDRLVIEGRADEKGLDAARIELVSGEGRAHGSGSLPWRAGGGAAIVQVETWPFQALVGGTPVSARLSGRADVGGSLASPRLLAEASLRVDDLRWRAFGPLALDGTISTADDAAVVSLVEAESAARIHARIGLGEGLPITASGDFPRLRLALPVEGSGGNLAAVLGGVAVSLAGELKDLARLETSAVAQSFELDDGRIIARSLDTVRVAGTAEALTLEPMRLSLFGSEFSVSGSARLTDPAAWNVEAEGEVDLEALEAIVPEARIAGKARVRLAASGAGGESLVEGDVAIADGYLNHPDFRQSLRAVTAQLSLSGRQVRLERLEGILGGGRVTATGGAELDGLTPSTWRLAIQGEGVALHFPEDVRSVSDFELALSGGGGDVLLEGDVRLLRGRYTGVMSTSSGGPTIARLRPPGPLDHLLLDLRLRAEDQFVVDNDLLKAEFRADLDIVGTGSHPVVLGSLDAVRAGLLHYRRTTFDLTDTSLVFTRSFPNDPELDAHATARLGLHDVSLHLTGRGSEPFVDLSSQPELPQESLAAMLATSGVLAASAGDTLGAPLPAPFAGGRSARDGQLTTAGLDPLRLDPVLVEGSSLTAARLTLGRQITPRLFAGYSLSLGGDQAGIVEMRYRARPRLELRLAHAERGTNIGEVRWTRTWRTRRGEEEWAVAAAGPFVRDVFVLGVAEPADKEAIVAALDLGAGDAADRSALLRSAGQARSFLVEHDHPLARVDCDAGPVHPARGTAAWPGGESEGGEPTEIGGAGGSPPFPPPGGESEGGEPTELGGTSGPPPSTGLPPSEVDVTCHVDAGARVSLSIDGVDEGGAKAARNAVLEAWGELAFRDELVPAAAIAAQDALLARGHARVTVRGAADDADDGLDVRLTIDPGEVVRVGLVAVEGAAEIESAAIVRALASSRRVGLKRPKLTPALASQDAEIIESIYQADGFLDAAVSAPDVSYPTDAPLARLAFEVDEGERQRVVGVVFEGNATLTTDELQSRFPLSIGDVARPEKLDAFVREVSEDLDARGRPDASVAWRLRRVQGGVIVEIVVSAGPQVRIGDVRVEGALRTRESIVRRELRARTGDPFTRASLVAMRRRLSDLGLFQSVVVRGEPRTDGPAVRDVLVRVVEKPDVDLAIGLGVQDGDPRGSVSLGQRNIAGTGASFGLQAQVAGKDRLVRLLGGLRRVGGTRNDLLLMGGYERDDRPGFTVDKNFVGVQLSRSLTKSITLLPRVRWEDVSVPWSDPSQTDPVPSEGVIAGPGLALVRDTRDDPLWPRRGSLASLDVSLSSDAFGAGFSFTKAFAQYSFARSFGRNGLIAAGSIRVGAGWSYDAPADPSLELQFPALPVSERFLAGGVGTVRGWNTDHLGPRDDDDDWDEGGGDAVRVLNAELRVPVTRNAWFIAFADAGNVLERPSQLLDSSFEYTVGPGVALSTPLGPLRFFYGHKLRDVPGENRGEFHFTFGTTF